MPNVAKLKKKAADFELKKQFDKALAVYVELLANFDEYANELDVALFNRVGDILVRQGNVADAVDYYERAVDYYSEGGFFNNAIALCNKILRHSPGRTSIYYKLGKISAQKGFKNDAKQNFLEYADRMQKGGRIDEAFRALTEFADLCPDQDDIRLMLADQLTKAGRNGEAVEQLQLLHERYSSEGRTTEAAAAAARLRAIDPTVEPRAGSAAPQQTSRDLVFLDLGDSAAQQRHSPATSQPPQPAPTRPAPPRPAPPAGGARPAPPRPAPSRPTPAALADLPLIHAGDDEPIAQPERKVPPAPAAASHARFAPPAPPAAPEVPAAESRAPQSAPEPESTEPDIELADAMPEPAESELTGEPSIAGFETTQIANDDSAGASSLLDVDSTSFGGSDEIARGFPSAADSLLDMPDDPFGSSGSMVEPPAEPIFDFGEGLLDESMGEPLDLVDPTEAAHGASASTGAALDDEALDLVLPDGLETPSPRESGELLAELEPPISREEPPSQDAAEPPLLDFEAPSPARAPGRRASAPVPDLTLTDDVASAPAPPSNGVPRRQYRPRTRPPAAPAPPTPELVVPDVAQAESVEEIEVELAIEEESEAAPLAPRSATLFAARSVEALRTAVESDPENWDLRRELGEAMLESGDRDGGVQELETAMLGAERANDLDLAGRIAEEITRIDPGTIRHLQKRVEYAFRTNDRPRLIEAYLDLGEALSGTDQLDKARAVYQRVLELAPDDIRAQAALEALPEPEPEPAPEAAPARRVGGAGKRSAAPRPRGSAPVAPVDPDSFVNLGDIMRDEVGPADTRMVVEEHEPTGDEEADFQDMLRKFKQGIAQNVDQEDYQAHYDLGVAFKEMGLVNEAIAEFQKALRAPSNRVPTYEALGQCFMEKEQYSMASTVLSRALNEERSTDDQLVGVLYLLGRAAEAMNRLDEALTYYQRVFLVDIEFQDVASRVRELERVAR